MKDIPCDIYRVEHPHFNIGPYRIDDYFLKKAFKPAMLWKYSKMIDAHRNSWYHVLPIVDFWYDEKTYRTKNNLSLSDDIYGFTSLNALKRWFDGYLEYLVDDLNFSVVVYKGVKKWENSESKNQCIFRPERSTVKEILIQQTLKENEP